MTKPLLVTDSRLPDEHFIREAAIAVLARDALLGHDSRSVENAVEWSRMIVDKYEHSEHDGDCVKRAHTCIRCLVDEAKREATEEHNS